MGEALEKQPPVQQSVHVDCPIEDAFEMFTENFEEWWPLAEGREVEKKILTWDPPNHVEFTWGDADQTVSVEFCVEADGTRVTLTHSGWEWMGVEFQRFVCEQRMLVMA